MDGISTVVAAVSADRRYVCYRIEKEYIDVARAKLGLFADMQRSKTN